MLTISEAAQRVSRQIAWRVSWLVALLLAILAMAFLTWNSYFRVDAGISAISGQLSNLLKVGDTFQIKTQLLSLSSSGIVDNFELQGASDFTIRGNQNGETSTPNSLIADYSGRDTLKFLDGSLNMVKSYNFSVNSEMPSKLVVSKKLHLEIFLLVIVAQVLIFIIVRLVFQRYVLSFATNLTKPMTDLALSVTSAKDYDELAANEELRRSLHYKELGQTLDAFTKLLSRLKNEEFLRREAERGATLSEIASQVSHDIRSPLSALNMLIGCAIGLPEDERSIFRTATQRINDIANNLLSKSKDIHFENALECSRENESKTDSLILTVLVDSVASEKRIQFRDHLNVNIETDLSDAYGLFIESDPTEIARAVSNLVNNSVEAFDNNHGTVTIRVHEEDKKLILTVQDNGKGIDPQILERLGRERLSSGKSNSNSGSGLGLLHARKTAEKFGGKMKIESNVGEGTIVSLVFQKADVPCWFIGTLKIPQGSIVVTIDDDQTIHQIWAERLKVATRKSSSFHHMIFPSPESFESWYRNTLPNRILCLVDYEFLGQKENGLDLIERIGINSRSVLVSSRYDECEIKKRSEQMGVKMIPKSFAPFIPIEFEYSAKGDEQGSRETGVCPISKDRVATFVHNLLYILYSHVIADSIQNLA